MTTITPHQASYLAHELQRKYSSETLDKLTASLHDAQVDLNPHQVEAALFAFHSPLSAGAILADEVGLGKTIEAGLVVSQWWAARQRKILIITPATLRKQWSSELAEKFFLPSVIMEKKVFDETLKRSPQTNPFAQDSVIIILSHEFARSKQDYIQQISWDLVVIDEAHRLRNVYKGNKTGTALKEALQGRKKILLTATPLQNSLMEMYGLVSLIDEHIFGDDVSFREQFVSRSGSRNIQELRDRLAQVCKRTLRKHVREYISYTERRCISHDFFPTDEETALYNYLNAYLQEERLFALPNRQRQLITLVVRKMLASSTFAISGTLAKFLQRLRDLETEQQPTELSLELLQELADDFGVSDEFNDETIDENTNNKTEGKPDDGNDRIPLSAEELRDLRREIEQLEKFYTLATSITANTKAEALCTALDKAFVTLDGLGAPRKAIIFTEFARTQTYLKQFLEQHGFAGEIVLFNGSNNDAGSQCIYKAWLERHKGSSRITGSKTADMRAALVEEFRERATLMIATEAAAEGINLQFCSLVVNYDLPWNPQRIEQRIGRCHRYGQKFDVVVVNLVNQKNPVDKRVYDVLGAKFRLFDGVFGASDDVLGALESGVDFEQRINAICNECRTEEEIARAFDALQHELQDSINARLQETHNVLFENFDRHVIDKLHVSKQQTEERLTAFEHRLWELTRFALGANAEFATDKRSFVLTTNPFPDRADIPVGSYRLSRHFRHGEQEAVQQKTSATTNPDIISDANVYRLSHPLAEQCIETIKQHPLPPACLVFDCSGTRPHVFGLQPLIGRMGWLRVSLLTVTAFETEDFFLLSACTDDGKMFEILDSERCEQLLSLSANIEPLHSTLPENIHQHLLQSHAEQQAHFAGEANLRTMRFYDEQSEKLDTWEDDALSAYTLQMKSIKDLIKLRKGEMKTITTAAEKIAAQRGIQELQQRSNDLQREQFKAQTDIARQKKTLLDELEKEINQQLHIRELFTVQWRII